MRTIPYPKRKATVSRLDEIRQRQESKKPGISYKIINDRLAAAALNLIKCPTNTPWSELGPAVKEAVQSSRSSVGKSVTSKVLKSFGLEKYDV